MCIGQILGAWAGPYSSCVTNSHAGAAPEALDIRALRTALGAFATGVTVVTCRGADDGAIGLTVNSFNALSLDPPLILWSLRLASPSLAAFDAARHFAINVLAEAQVDVSRRFASPVGQKFDEGPWHEGLHRVPVLGGCAAVFECELLSQQSAGDHRLYIGRVLKMQSQPVAPLVYHGGHYHLLGEVL
jgi:4-hydroxyphenylacetate 3-hydroxylase, reductase component